jgi:hypothetical protein
LTRQLTARLKAVDSEVDEAVGSEVDEAVGGEVGRGGWRRG